MKSLSTYTALLGFVLCSSIATADVVYDTTQTPPPPSGAYWWYGPTNYQEEGNVIALAGTARTLQSVVLHNFTTDPGTYNVSASIYAIPSTINNGDTLSNPLWTQTVQFNGTGSIGQVFDVNFQGGNFLLPDQFVLDFAFTQTSANGDAGMFCQGEYAGDPAYNPPAVGQIISDNNYDGEFSYPASWQVNTPGTLYLCPVATINAVPDPAPITTLGVGLVGILCFRRRKGA